MKKRALMLASVASMIDQFNMRNIKILQQLGYKVDVACNFEVGNTTSDERLKRFKKELDAKGIAMYQLDIPRSIYRANDIIKSYFQVKNLLKKNQYDLVHCHSPIGGIVARLACRNFKQTKLIYTAHGFHFFKGSSLTSKLIYFNIEKICSRYTECLITINHEDYDNAKKYFKAKKIEYIPGIGIDVQAISNQLVNKSELRKSLKIPEDAFVLFNIGELSKRKNQEVAIRALSEIEDENVILCICGKGPLEDYLKKLTEELKISERVKFLGYRTDVVELLFMADLFVFPSFQEGLPTALMEAMAAHLPCVASKIRGNTDLLGNDSQYLLDASDFKLFADTILSIKQDRLKAIMIGESNFKKVQVFDKKNVDKKMKEIYLML